MLLTVRETTGATVVICSDVLATPEKLQGAAGWGMAYAFWRTVKQN